MYQTANKVIIQESGDVVTVHPSAIHNVNNLGVNLAENLNFLPSSKFLLDIYTYKTYETSEGYDWKPNMNYVENLKQNFDVKASIHKSNLKRQYKINKLNYFKKKNYNEHFYGAIKHMKNSHYIP